MAFPSAFGRRGRRSSGRNYAWPDFGDDDFSIDMESDLYNSYDSSNGFSKYDIRNMGSRGSRYDDDDYYSVYGDRSSMHSSDPYRSRRSFSNSFGHGNDINDTGRRYNRYVETSRPPARYRQRSKTLPSASFVRGPPHLSGYSSNSSFGTVDEMDQSMRSSSRIVDLEGDDSFDSPENEYAVEIYFVQDKGGRGVRKSFEIVKVRVGNVSVGKLVEGVSRSNGDEDESDYDCMQGKRSESDGERKHGRGRMDSGASGTAASSLLGSQWTVMVDARSQTRLSDVSDELQMVDRDMSLGDIARSLGMGLDDPIRLVVDVSSKRANRRRQNRVCYIE